MSLFDTNENRENITVYPQFQDILRYFHIDKKL